MEIFDLEELKKINIEKIDGYKSNGNEIKLEVHEKIKSLLDCDKNVFFRMSIDDAYIILDYLIDDKSKIDDIYIKLTSPENFIQYIK